MIKEQKGRIVELVRGKQDAVAQLKVSGWCVYPVNRPPILSGVYTMSCDILYPYKARIAELEVEVGTRNKLESKLEAIQEVSFYDVTCGVLD